jgi:hypothetical protein
MTEGWDLSRANGHASRRRGQDQGYGSVWQWIRAMCPRIEWRIW